MHRARQDRNLISIDQDHCGIATLNATVFSALGRWFLCWMSLHMVRARMGIFVRFGWLRKRGEKEESWVPKQRACLHHDGEWRCYKDSITSWIDSCPSWVASCLSSFSCFGALLINISLSCTSIMMAWWSHYVLSKSTLFKQFTPRECKITLRNVYMYFLCINAPGENDVAKAIVLGPPSWRQDPLM